VRESFWLATDRFDYLSRNDGIKPETLAKLKTGWLPDSRYYELRRIKYPWRYQLTGNARMLEFKEFKESKDNNERFYIGPWMLDTYQHLGAMRGVPVAATFWFNDNAGKRHSIYLGFFNGERVIGEKNVSEVRAAFEKLFPKRELWQNDFVPGEKDMATLRIHVSDDFNTYSASLVKGDVEVDIQIYRAQFFNLEPYTHWPKGVTPDKAAIQRLTYGPDA
jgi:hypothetical protein